MRVDNNKRIEFKNDRSWLIKELNKPRGQRLVKSYVAMLMSGEVDFKILGNIYRQELDG